MRGFLCLALAVPGFAMADNYALRFDGRALARMNPSKALDITRGLTIEAWVKREGGDPDQSFRFVVSHNMGGTGYSIVLGRDYNLQGQSAPVVLPDGRWVHVAYAMNNRISKIYLDGKLAHTQQVTEILRENDEFFWVGSSPFRGIPGDQLTGFSGLIDEVRVWNGPRSETQIRRDMRRLLPVPTRHLRVYLPFDEGRGEKARNREGRTGALMFGSLIGAEGRAPVWERVPSLRER